MNIGVLKLRPQMDGVFCKKCSCIQNEIAFEISVCYIILDIVCTTVPIGMDGENRGAPLMLCGT